MNNAHRTNNAGGESEPVTPATSLSDTGVLHDSIAMALKYPGAWMNFRCTPGFLYAIENVEECWHREIIDATDPSDWIDQAFRGDIGNPPKLCLPTGSWISPTMLRYTYFSRIMGKRFPMNGANVIEIGGGFGGQCYVCNQHWQFVRWCHVDLPDMLEIARKYLDYFGVKSEYISCHSPKEFFPSPRNLQSSDAILVSNYAFSECTRAMQEFYMENIIRHCPHGFMILNQPARDFDSMTMDEIVERMKKYRQVHVRSEKPKTGHGLLELGWGER